MGESFTDNLSLQRKRVDERSDIVCLTKIWVVGNCPTPQSTLDYKIAD